PSLASSAWRTGAFARPDLVEEDTAFINRDRAAAGAVGANNPRTAPGHRVCRFKCSNRVEESFRDVTLSDMAQAPSLLKSIIDSIEGDIKGVSAAQSQLAELADKMDSSYKAILTIQKIHRAMCVRVQQPARAAAEGGGTVGPPLLLQPTGPFMNR